MGLVDPKPGVFKPHIRHLLILITATDILLLGVGFSPGSGPDADMTGAGDAAASSSLAEMHLLPEPLFTLPTDNVVYMTVVGTDKGRIFLGGKDNALTEIDYQVRGCFGPFLARRCNWYDRLKAFLQGPISVKIQTLFCERVESHCLKFEPIKN